MMYAAALIYLWGALILAIITIPLRFWLVGRTRKPLDFSTAAIMTLFSFFAITGLICSIAIVTGVH